MKHWWWVLTAATAALQIRDKPVVFNEQRRVLREEDGLVILYRNSTIPSPFIQVVSKFHYLIDHTTYVPLENDQITPWLPEYKYDDQDSLPVVIHTYNYDPPNSTRLADNYWVTNITSIAELVAHPRVISIDSFRPLVMFSQNARNVHFDVTDRPPTRFTGADITIGIADTGFDIWHCALNDPEGTVVYDQITPNAHTKVSSLVTAWPGVTDYRGENGAHGTMTASAAAGYDCISTVGTAPAAKLALYDFSPNDDDIYLRTSDGPGIMTFYEYLELAMTIGGVSVWSFSWGSSNQGRYDTMSSILDRIAYDRYTVNFFVAVGNSPPPAKPSSPSTGKNMNSVGAGQSTIASFSSRGPLPDGRQSPIMYSPGVNERLAYGYYETEEGHNHYTLASGTSFSTPNLAGVAAEIKSVYRANNGHDAYAPLVTAILMSHATDLDNGVYGVPMLTEGTVKQGLWTETISYCFVVPNCGSDECSSLIKMALVWVDYPAIAYTSHPLINKLDVDIYVNGMLLATLADDVNPHKIASIVNVVPTSQLRLVIRGSSLVGILPYGLSLSIPMTTVTTCGTCQPHEKNACGTDGFYYCQPTSGMFTDECLLRSAIIPAIGEPCRGNVFDGAMVGNTCTVVTCDEGFYYQDGTCKCIEGVHNGNNICTENAYTIRNDIILVSNGVVITGNILCFLFVWTLLW